jgi:hypothetical protein
MKEICQWVSPEYFKVIKERVLPFYIGKDDDVETGDIIVLIEWDKERNKDTGYTEYRKVSYVIRNIPELGLMDGFCIIGFERDDPRYYTNSEEVTVKELMDALSNCDEKVIVLNGDEENIRMICGEQSRPGVKNHVMLW